MSAGLQIKYNMNISRKYILIAILLLFFLAIGLGVGYFWGFNTEQAVLNRKLNVIRPLRENNSGYSFIDPLLAYIIPSADQETGMISIKNKISDSINSDKKNNNLTDASVFFYDLNKGRWIGVNETEKYNPASMLKVVIMVVYLKESEQSASVLGSYLVYTKQIDDIAKQDPFNTLPELKVGESYKVSDLINKMIIDSDNGSETLLLNSISQMSLDSIYNALNMENPDVVDGFTISPRTYSLFLRILYSATYLNSVDSEKALNILSKTTFVDGLVAGVPKNTVVAHKFGEHIIQQDDQAQQIELHDCGIIYYPKNPYLLCVMTKGNNLDNLKNTIKSISSLVYQNYSSLK
jgi:beta-lactamase class A